MKKLGILTFNRVTNYGAVLQAYALKSVCEDLGYETHVIDYALRSDDGPHPIQAFLKSNHSLKSVLRLTKSLLSYPWNRARWVNVKEFRSRYLDETEPCSSAADLSALEYDTYLMGSDQIWNYHITGGRFDPSYFGILPGKHKCVVYAASAHDTPFPADQEFILQRLLNQTEASISIRENKLADYVARVFGKSFPVVLDPTLLAGKQVMERVEAQRRFRHPFILLYQIDANPASDICIRSLEKCFGRRVVSMTVPKLGSMHGKKGWLGPEAFLSVIDQAEFVVTNSFHGVALSLLWHKQFFVYENGGVMTRIDNLLGIVQLDDRKVCRVSDIDLERTIDYEKVDSILGEERNKSLNFLRNALEGKIEGIPYEESGSFTKSVPFQDRKKADCSGCSACVEICPVKAINMVPDQEGFLYPTIDSRMCIHCRACDHFCSFFPEPRRDMKELPEAYGVKHKNIKIRRNSRSGGAFVAISDRVLEKQGIVYGAVQSEDGVVRHIRAQSKEERDKMQGAKYVQSDLSGIFPQLLRDIQEDRKVLFSGTPCQVAGVRSVLRYKKIPEENLLTCDLVCHGVPSPKIWRDYRSYIEAENHSPIVKADFRDKSFGWDSHCESFALENGKKVVSRDYTDLFYEHLMFRPSCHNCQFSNLNRVSDLSLADFWGIEKNAPAFEDREGVSLVLVNSPKGAEAFAAAKNDLEVVPCNVLNCLQPTLVKPSDPSPLRDEFWECYQKNGFAATMKRYTRPASTLKRMKWYMKRFLFSVGIRDHP